MPSNFARLSFDISEMENEMARRLSEGLRGNRTARIRIGASNEVKVAERDLNAYNAVKQIVDDGKKPVTTEPAISQEDFDTYKRVAVALSNAAAQRLGTLPNRAVVGMMADGEMEVYSRNEYEVTRRRFFVRSLVDFLNGEVDPRGSESEPSGALLGCNCEMCTEARRISRR